MDYPQYIQMEGLEGRTIWSWEEHQAYLGEWEKANEKLHPIIAESVEPTVKEQDMSPCGGNKKGKGGKKKSGKKGKGK